MDKAFHIRDLNLNFRFEILQHLNCKRFKHLQTFIPPLSVLAYVLLWSMNSQTVDFLGGFCHGVIFISTSSLWSVIVSKKMRKSDPTPSHRVLGTTVSHPQSFTFSIVINWTNFPFYLLENHDLIPRTLWCRWRTVSLSFSVPRQRDGCHDTIQILSHEKEEANFRGQKLKYCCDRSLNITGDCSLLEHWREVVLSSAEYGTRF